MTSKWESGYIGDLIQEPFLEVAAEPWNHELITVRLHAKGLIPAGKSPNRTRSARKHYFRRRGQILIGRQNFHRQCVGVVDEALDGLVTSNAISAFVPRSGVDKAFALLVLQSPSIAETADQLMPGTGQREISVRTLLSIPVAIPPLPEQRRIVDLIGALDDAIEAAEEQELLAGELLENLQGDWPAGEEVRLGFVLTDIVGGVSAKPSDEQDDTNNVGVLKVSAVRSARFQPAEIKRLGNLSMPERAKVHNGDLLMTRSNTPSTVGQVCIADNVQENCYLPDLIWRLEVDQSAVTPTYLSHFLSSTRMRSAITGVARGTSPSMRKVNKQSVSSLTIILPTLEAQRSYADLCDAASKTTASYREKVESLRSLRTELLTALLSGAHEMPESYESVMESANA